MADNGGPKIQPKIEKDMLKPLIFANHEKHFKIFSYLVSFGIVYYFVFKHDFGEKRHCFTWIRELADEGKRKFFTIDPDDEMLLMQKEKANKKLIDKNNN